MIFIPLIFLLCFKTQAQINNIKIINTDWRKHILYIRHMRKIVSLFIYTRETTITTISAGRPPARQNKVY